VYRIGKGRGRSNVAEFPQPLDPSRIDAVILLRDQDHIELVDVRVHSH